MFFHSLKGLSRPRRWMQWGVTGGLLSVMLLNGMAFAYTPQSLYDDVWKLINTRFVSDDKNSQDWRIWRHRYDEAMQTDDDAYVAIETMLASLNDRYTRFLDPEEFADEGMSIKAQLFGIGIQIGTRDNKLLVISPIDDTPAARAGLIANDEILEIDGKSTQGISVKEAADMIRGEKGTTVKLLVKREGRANKVYPIVRDEIKLKSVSSKTPFETKLPGNVGYIKLSTFLSNKAATELKASMDEQAGKAGYILDLRSNPGGLLTNAIKIANYFIDSGSIVSTVDRDGYKNVKYAEPEIVTKKPLVVLIDGGSASASEILSGALKDHQRALLVGQKSFGKGLVQEINPLPGGSGVNITTQKYLTPNDIDINKMGIEPDIAVEHKEEDSKAKRDPQLQQAVKALEEMIGGKSVKLMIAEHKAELEAKAHAAELKDKLAQKPDEKCPTCGATVHQAGKKPAKKK
ncbi:MAG: S41 family peptidase [Candidatus Melainabacteria bacterium]